MARRHDRARRTNDPREISLARKVAGRRDRERRRAWREVLKTPLGRRVVWDELERAGIFQTVFSTEALVMAHRSGRHDHGKELLAFVIELAPDLYVLMEREQRERMRVEVEELKDTAVVADRADDEDDHEENADAE